MPLAWLRRSSRAVAAVVLLVSMWQLPHRADDDEICAPGTAEVHDESQHVYTGAGDSAGEDHCEVCHWLRSLNPALGGRGLAAVPAESGTPLWSRVTRGLRDPGTDRLPARAPPLL